MATKKSSENENQSQENEKGWEPPSSEEAAKKMKESKGPDEEEDETSEPQMKHGYQPGFHPPKTEVPEGISASDVKKIVAEALANFQAASTGDDDAKRRLDSMLQQYDPNDEMEPVTFFAWGISKIIMGYGKNGFEVRAPMNMEIVFKIVNSTKIGGGKNDEQIVHTSAYKCTSKKIYDYLINHPWYNVQFFQDFGEAQGNPEERVFELEALAAINNLPGTMLIQEAMRLRAEGKNITMTKDPTKLKRQLLPYFIERAKKNKDESQRAMLERADKVNKIIQREGVLS